GGDFVALRLDYGHQENPKHSREKEHLHVCDTSHARTTVVTPALWSVDVNNIITEHETSSGEPALTRWPRGERGEEGHNVSDYSTAGLVRWSMLLPLVGEG